MPGPKDIEDYFDQYVQSVTRKSSELPDEQEISSFSAGPPPDPEYALFHDVIAQLRWELAHEAFAAMLAGFADWAGRELTTDDLPEIEDTFGVPEEAISVDLYNEHVRREHLDQWATGNGVTRIPAKFATGEVRFFVRDDTVTINSGTVVSTGDTGRGKYEYTVRETRDPPVGDSVIANVPIIAQQAGRQHNVGSGAISTIEGSSAGVEDITNPQAITGGEPEEQQEEFRERAKRALEFNTVGVTEQGIVGELYRTFDGVETDDVQVIQHRDPTADDNTLGYPYADVVVDGGGTDEEIEAVLDDLQYPVVHRLQRPIVHELNIEAVLRPTEFAAEADISTTRAENAVLRWLSEFGIAEPLSMDRLRYEIIQADPEDIGDIDNLSVIDTYSGNSISEDIDFIGKRGKIAPGTVTFTTGQN